MAGYNELRDNGDGTYSLLVEITDAAHVQQVSQKKTTATLTAHSAVSVRDTANNEVLVDVVDVTGEKLVVINSTLNQAVDISLFAEGTGYTYITLGAAKNIAINGTGVISSGDIPGLRAPISKLRVRAKATVAPTTGNLSIYVEGVQA